MRNNQGEFSYAILGTGALGGLYGGLLARAGKEVHFLARSDFEQLQRHGLRVESPLGDFHLRTPSVFADAAEMPRVDVAIVAWKATGNAALTTVLPAVCHDETIVLVLQNGLEVEQDAARLVPAERVLGGCCFLCSNKLGPGHIKHLDYGRIAFGEISPKYHGQVTHRMLALTEDFRSAGIDMQPAADLKTVRWKKLAWNIPFNGLSVVLAADTRQIMLDPASARLAEELMREVQRAAEACGSRIEDGHVTKMLEDTRKMVPYDSSMLLDYRARRPMELEAIFGNPLRAAAEAGYTPPKIEMLYRQLSFLDTRNRAAAP